MRRNEVRRRLGRNITTETNSGAFIDLLLLDPLCLCLCLCWSWSASLHYFLLCLRCAPAFTTVVNVLQQQQQPRSRRGEDHWHWCFRFYDRSATRTATSTCTRAGITAEAAAGTEPPVQSAAAVLENVTSTTHELCMHVPSPAAGIWRTSE